MSLKSCHVKVSNASSGCVLHCTHVIPRKHICILAVVTHMEIACMRYNTGMNKLDNRLVDFHSTDKKLNAIHLKHSSF